MSWRMFMFSIQVEFLEPIDIFVERLLVFLLEQEIPDQQIIHIRSHETGVGMLRCADDGFAANIERRIDNDGAAIFVRELFDHSVIQGMLLSGYRLDAGRVIYMRYGRDGGTHREQSLQSE